jgi:hypothetical protein
MSESANDLYARLFVREVVLEETICFGYRVCLDGEVICTFGPSYLNWAMTCKDRLKLLHEDATSWVRIDQLVARYNYEVDTIGKRRWLEGEEEPTLKCRASKEVQHG